MYLILIDAVLYEELHQYDGAQLQRGHLRVREGQLPAGYHRLYPISLLHFQRLLHGAAHLRSTKCSTQTAIMLFLFEAVSHLSNEFLAPCVENIVESFSIRRHLCRHWGDSGWGHIPGLRERGSGCAHGDHRREQ